MQGNPHQGRWCYQPQSQVSNSQMQNTSENEQFSQQKLRNGNYFPCVQNKLVPIHNQKIPVQSQQRPI